MKIGFGTRDHGGALMVAGAEKVFFHPEDLNLILEFAGVSVREGDTLIVVSSGLLTAQQIKKIRDACKGEVEFQVVGHEPESLASDRAIKEFRAKYPIGVETAVPQATGRPKDVKYTVEQADAIIRLWHEVPKRKPSEIVLLADKILGLPDGSIEKHWVRDLVKKYVGTAQREKPKGWRGVRIN